MGRMIDDRISKVAVPNVPNHQDDYGKYGIRAGHQHRVMQRKKEKYNEARWNSLKKVNRVGENMAFENLSTDN